MQRDFHLSLLLVVCVAVSSFYLLHCICSLVMARDKISIKFLIHLVSERPALWDKTTEAYRDRELRETSWREICTFVNEDYDKLKPEEKVEFTKMVTKKWSHIRDAWVKSMKNGYDEITQLPLKPYVYHEDLKFLQKMQNEFTAKSRIRRYDLVMTNFARSYERRQDSIVKQQRGSENHNEHVTMDNGENTNDTDCNSETMNDILKQIDEDEDGNNCNAGATKTTNIEIKKEGNRIQKDKETSPNLERPQLQLKYPRSLAVAKTNLQQNQCCDKRNLSDNRHWNFFKGVIPSLNTLDDDHTLQFQGSVISLIQKLKTSQEQATKATRKSGRKRPYSHMPDFEWPMHKVHIGKRASKRTNDPIATESNEDEEGSENSSSE